MQTAEVNGTQLAYIDEGPREGIPVVLSHSLFFDHRMFYPLIEQLSARGYRVVAFDHRGQGASATGTRDQLAVDNLTADASALIEHLALGPTHVVGNSLGGMVALRLAARRPDLLRSAAALGSSAEEEHNLAQFSPLIDHISEHGVAELVDMLVHMMFGDTSLDANDAVVVDWRTHIANLAPSIADAAYGVVHRSSVLGELSGCRVPVIAIAGTEDHAYPPPISTTNIADAAGGKSFEVKAAGHSVALEQPEIVAGYLADHFAYADELLKQPTEKSRR